jgi:hypothetical protein
MNYVISKNIDNTIRYGVISNNGETILDLKYDSLQITDDYFIVELNKAFGVINSTNEFLIEIEYNSIEKCQVGFIVKKNNFYGLISFSGELAVEIKYNSFFLNNDCFFVEVDGCMGVLNFAFELIVPIKFDAVFKHQIENLYVVSIKNKFGLFDIQNNLLTDLIFDEIYNSRSKDFIIAKLNGKYGFISIDGIWTINPIYDSVIDFDDNDLSIVRIGFRTGLIDKNEKWVIKPMYIDIQFFENNYILISNDNTKLLYDKNGNYIKDFNIDKQIHIKKFEIYYENHKFGLIDSEKNFIIEPNLEYLTEIKNELFIFYKNSKLGLITSKNEIVLEPIYEIKSWYLPHPNILGVLLNDNYVFIELDNFRVIGEDILHIDYFREGSISIATNKFNKQGVVDENLNWLVFPIYDKLYCKDSNNLFKALIGRKYGWIDLNGSWIIQPIYDLNYEFENGLLQFVIDSLEFAFPEDSDTFFLIDNIPSLIKLNLDIKFLNGLKHLCFIDDSIDNDMSSGIYISIREKEVFLVLVEKWSKPVVISLNPSDENKRLKDVVYDEAECLLILTFESYDDLPEAQRRLIVENETNDSVFKLNSTFVFSFYNKKMMDCLVKFLEDIISHLN